MTPTNAPSSATRRPLLWVIFLIYMGILTKIILIKIPSHFMMSLRRTWRHGFDRQHARPNLKPFSMIKNFIDHGSTQDAWTNVGGNILIFIPFGIFVPLLLKGQNKLLKTFFLAFLLSVAFELFQLYTGCGFFDVDDIILNTAGGLMGIGLCAIYNGITKKKSHHLAVPPVVS